jgi:hypothetical protein
LDGEILAASRDPCIAVDHANLPLYEREDFVSYKALRTLGKRDLTKLDRFESWCPTLMHETCPNPLSMLLEHG